MASTHTTYFTLPPEVATLCATAGYDLADGREVQDPSLLLDGDIHIPMGSDKISFYAILNVIGESAPSSQTLDALRNFTQVLDRGCDKIGYAIETITPKTAPHCLDNIRILRLRRRVGQVYEKLIEKSLKSSESERVGLEGKVSSLVSKLEETRRAKALLRDAERAKTTLRSTITDYTTSLTRAKEEQKELRAQLKEAIDNGDEKATELKSQLESAQSSIAMLSEKLDTSQSQYAKLEESIEALKDKHREEISFRDTLIVKVVADNALMKGALAAATIDSEAKDARIDQLEEELETTRRSESHKADIVGRQALALKGQIAREVELRKELQATKSVLSDTRVDYMTLSKKFKALSVCLNILRNAHQAKTRKLKEATKELEKIKATNWFRVMTFAQSFLSKIQSTTAELSKSVTA